MRTDPALPPSDVADANAVGGNVSTLSTRSTLVSATIPFAVIGGTPRAQGFQSVDSTTYVEVFRSDVYVTTRYLWYDFQVTSAYGVAPTSIDWQVEVRWPYNAGLPTTVLATGAAASGDQVQNVADLFTLVSRSVYSEVASVRLSVKRTGGSGEAAGVRMIKPWLLRSVSA